MAAASLFAQYDGARATALQPVQKSSLNRLNSLLANAGISDDIRRKITGHTTTKMNQVYTHMEAKLLQEALQRAVSDKVK